ncbi:tRNA-Thr(GGU) m(6)t(6)A37 methyltransferase TsaA [Thermococcus profundus]|uniref:tRNA-Thr(GGU) m(6)t(6)A37 methyltransferase TsaA n=1 Tax=Thermococcus profundus TaxID=49899 RepID=A0A2Z2MJH3_THEPR|nr:tRNA (N6-threonylcarbamoyladenosine(37)-N6)-methyltransferase TrmO [Thermococcus profundus]ASJ02581.1 tRNA-Thr(GGU) m(6)t(6)A37 methyltransferase TsaA [Thermococcus profundus]
MDFEPFKIVPVGYLRNDERLHETSIEVLPEFTEAIEGLREGDWIKLLLWFHESDGPEKRRILKVHPRGNPRNPVRGVFATRSPYRPNPVALYTVQIHRIEGNMLYIDWIDARDGTPVVDIKPFVERLDCPFDEIEERELDLDKAFWIGKLRIIPRKSEHLDELEEVSPEEYDSLIIEIGPKATTLSARELKDLINFLKEVYDNLPVEIKDRLGEPEC